MNKRILPLLAGLWVVPAGCTMIPEHERPAAPIPTTFPSGPAYRTEPAPPEAPAPVDLAWQDFITDTRLAKIIAIALENNRDLRLASLNVERTRAIYGIRRAELFPAADVAAGASRRRLPGDMSVSGKRTTTDQYSVDFGVLSWEIDFFGRIRSLEAAALQQFFASQEARRSAQILLVSSVAEAYLRLAADRENLALAKTTLAAQQDMLDLVKRRFERGLVPELDVHRAQQQVETARVDVAQYTRLAAQDENALDLLAGTTVPDDLLPADLSEVSPPREIAAGVSSDVLLLRPDILEAENLLRAANANIGAARAAFFPRISLTGTLGTASTDLSGLFRSGSGTWAYGPQVALPVFDARIWAAARATETDREIAIAQYERAIQQSFREVADALAVRGTADQQVAAQDALVRAVSETYRLSNSRYEKGLDSYLSVLDAQRSLYFAQQQLVYFRMGKLANQINLYAALGGGWRSSEPPATQPAP